MSDGDGEFVAVAENRFYEEGPAGEKSPLVKHNCFNMLSQVPQNDATALYSSSIINIEHQEEIFCTPYR